MMMNNYGWNLAVKVQDNDLLHYGILGMKWGVRRYQNADGSYNSAGRARYGVGDGKSYQGVKGGGHASAIKKSSQANRVQKSASNKKSSDNQNKDSKKGLTKKQKIAIGVGIGVAAAVTTGAILHATGADKKIYDAGKEAVHNLAERHRYNKVTSQLEKADRAEKNKAWAGAKKNSKSQSEAIEKYGDYLSNPKNLWAEKSLKDMERTDPYAIKQRSKREVDNAFYGAKQASRNAAKQVAQDKRIREYDKRVALEADRAAYFKNNINSHTTSNANSSLAENLKNTNITGSVAYSPLGQGRRQTAYNVKTTANAASGMNRANEVASNALKQHGYEPGLASYASAERSAYERGAQAVNTYIQKLSRRPLR